MDDVETPMFEALPGPVGFFNDRLEERAWWRLVDGHQTRKLLHRVFGCCWLLMLLLFVAGVMNIWWVGAISIFVLAEKL